MVSGYLLLPRTIIVASRQQFDHGEPHLFLAVNDQRHRLGRLLIVTPLPESQGRVRPSRMGVDLDPPIHDVDDPVFRQPVAG